MARVPSCGGECRALENADTDRLVPGCNLGSIHQASLSWNVESQYLIQESLAKKPTLLFGVGARYPLTMGVVVVVVYCVPARRAARVDPVICLRQE